MAFGKRSLPLNSSSKHHPTGSFKPGAAPRDKQSELGEEKSWKERGQTQQEKVQGNGGCKPEFGPPSTIDGAACASQCVTGTNDSAQKCGKEAMGVVPRMLICICIRSPKKRELAYQICNFTRIFP